MKELANWFANSPIQVRQSWPFFGNEKGVTGPVFGSTGNASLISVTPVLSIFSRRR